MYDRSPEPDGRHVYRYLGIISDVLMSVKRKEDSLKKLKQCGRRSHDTVGGTVSMSDDDKIRLQLSLDIEAFVNQVSWKITGIDCIFAVFRYRACQLIRCNQ